jgi:hypothetical protein
MNRECFFDFSQNGDEEEQEFDKGIDPSDSDSKNTRLSEERVVFALKKFIATHPIVRAGAEWYAIRQRQRSLRHPRGTPCSGRECRASLVKVNATYVCTRSGHFHECPPSGCRLAKTGAQKDVRHCPLTGNDSHAIHRNVSDAPWRFGYEDIASSSSEDEEEEGDELMDEAADELKTSETATEAETAALHAHDAVVEPPPAKIQRVSREARQSNTQDIDIIRSSALATVRAIFPFASQQKHHDWVNNHILYLWNLVVQTNKYQVHSMTYKLSAHTRVVMDAMVEGFVVDGFAVVPAFAEIAAAVETGAVKIRATLKAKKFFRACLQETLDSSKNDKEILRLISERR